MLRVGYRSDELLTSLKELEIPVGLEVTFEQNDPSLEEMSNALKEAAERGDIRKGIGGMPPEGLVDAGRFLISIATSDEVIKNATTIVIGNTAWAFIKSIYLKVFGTTKKGPVIRDCIVIITDQYESSPHQVSISFILSSSLAPEELDIALTTLPAAREAIVRAYSDSVVDLDLANSGLIEARYIPHSCRWLVERKNVVEFREIPRRKNFFQRFFARR